MTAKPRGRPGRHAKYEQLLRELPEEMVKRPRYVDGIGLFQGKRGVTAWLKIRLRNGGTYEGKTYPNGSALEIKLGRLGSWTWDQLEAEYAKVQGKADRGEPLSQPIVPTFGEWANDWLARAKARLRSYPIVRIHVEKHLAPAFGGKSLAEIKVQDVNRWIAERLKAAKKGPKARNADKEVGAKPATVKRELDTLSTILEDAVKAGLLATNPCAQADTIKGIVGRQRFLGAKEMVRLLAEAGKVADWLPDFVLWCIHSGMRRGEVLALTWAQVRAVGKQTVLTIERSKSDQPRLVMCTPTMKEILQRQQGRKVKGSDAVFPVAAMTLRRRWEEARTNAGILDVTIHDLRRTHSTYAAAAGVDLRTLADRIGHADLTMLQKHYAALVGTAQAEAVNTIQRTFDKMLKEKPMKGFQARLGTLTHRS